jgi:hypothetical protein
MSVSVRARRKALDMLLNPRNPLRIPLLMLALFLNELAADAPARLRWAGEVLFNFLADQRTVAEHRARYRSPLRKAPPPILSKPTLRDNSLEQMVAQPAAGDAPLVQDTLPSSVSLLLKALTETAAMAMMPEEDLPSKVSRHRIDLPRSASRYHDLDSASPRVLEEPSSAKSTEERRRRRSWNAPEFLTLTPLSPDAPVLSDEKPRRRRRKRFISIAMSPAEARAIAESDADGAVPPTVAEELKMAPPHAEDARVYSPQRQDLDEGPPTPHRAAASQPLLPVMPNETPQRRRSGSHRVRGPLVSCAAV